MIVPRILGIIFSGMTEMAVLILPAVFGAYVLAGSEGTEGGGQRVNDRSGEIVGCTSYEICVIYY